MEAKLNKIVVFPIIKENGKVGLSSRLDKNFREVTEKIMQKTDSQALLNEIRTDDNTRHVTIFTTDESICNRVVDVLKASNITPIVNCNLTRMALTKINLVEVIGAFERMNVEVDFRCDSC